MSTLYIPVGAPGCGKSTLARKHFARHEIVCPDEYRFILTGDMADQSANAHVFDICHKITRLRLQHQQDVWFDATNCSMRALTELAGIAWAQRAAVVHVTFDVDLPECLRRNAERARPVPEDVVRRMFDQADGFGLVLSGATPAEEFSR